MCRKTKPPQQMPLPTSFASWLRMYYQLSCRAPRTSLHPGSCSANSSCRFRHVFSRRPRPHHIPDLFILAALFGVGGSAVRSIATVAPRPFRASAAGVWALQRCGGIQQKCSAWLFDPFLVPRRTRCCCQRSALGRQKSIRHGVHITAVCRLAPVCRLSASLRYPLPGNHNARQRDHQHRSGNSSGRFPFAWK